jgi:hypothetical protein
MADQPTRSGPSPVRPRPPHYDWETARWIQYRDSQLELRARAIEHGWKTDVIDACIRLADWHLDERTLNVNGENVMVVADHNDLEPSA